jgi:hypothetical protein
MRSQANSAARPSRGMGRPLTSAPAASRGMNRRGVRDPIDYDFDTALVRVQAVSLVEFRVERNAVEHERVKHHTVRFGADAGPSG